MTRSYGIVSPRDGLLHPSILSRIMCRRGSGHIVLTASQTGMVPDWYIEHGLYMMTMAGRHGPRDSVMMGGRRQSMESESRI